MLQITDDTIHNCLLVTPEGRLTESDFESLKRTFDARVAASGSTPNLVIHARAFPGWADFGGLVGHLAFVRDHHRLIRKIALVSDARILDIAPQVARTFLRADIRHFPADRLTDALAWVAAPETDVPAVRLIGGLPSDVLGVEVHGTVTARDYETVIVPAIEEKLARHPRIRLLYRVAEDFRAISPGAIWSDARIGLMNLTRFSRVALVSDHDWMRNAVRLFAPLMPGEVRVFPDAEYETAKAWIGGPDLDGEPTEADRAVDA